MNIEWKKRICSNRLHILPQILSSRVVRKLLSLFSTVDVPGGTL
jgi:hypothetical protein